MTEIKSTYKLGKTDLTKELNGSENTGNQVLAFLNKNAQKDDILLAYFQDGVLWGKVLNNELFTLESPSFKDESFLHAHLFNQEREIRVIQTLDGLKAFQFADIKANEKNKATFSYDRTYLLWGDQKVDSLTKELSANFTHVRMGSRGIEQILPLSFTPTSGDSKTQATLTVRYYLEASTRDKDKGNLSIIARRIVSIQEGGKHGA